MLHDAKRPKWLVDLANRMTCDICDSLKPGDEGKIIRVSTHQPAMQWQVICLDVAELEFPSLARKLKFLVIIDKATKLIAAVPLSIYGTRENFEPTSSQIIKSLSVHWL